MDHKRRIELGYESAADRPPARPVAAAFFLLSIVAALIAANVALLLHHFGPVVFRMLKPW